MTAFDIKKLQEKVDAFLAKYPAVDEPLSKLSSQVKVDKSYIALGGLGAIVLLIFWIAGGDFIVDIVGFAYPLYASFKAIESSSKEDDVQWLVYWLIFSIIKVTEELLPFVKSLPFYSIFKLGFLIYCYYPTTKGAYTIYSLVIKPFVVPRLGLASASPADDADTQRKID